MVCVREVMLLQLLGILLVGSLSSHVKGSDDVDMVSLPPAYAPSPYHKMPFTSGIAIEGVVYCLTCKIQGRLPLPNPSPLPGTVAKLHCNRPKHGSSVYGYATTDAKGYFLLMVPKMRPRALRMCKVVLTLPHKCSKPLFPSSALAEPLFERVEKIGPSYYFLYSAGFSEYAPPRPLLCRPRA